MTKKILGYIFISVIICAISGCTNNKNKFKVGKESELLVNETDVSLTLKEGSLTTAGAVFILENKSDKQFGWGPAWEIEMKKNGKWYEIDVVVSFTSPSWNLDAYERKEISINWKNSYGKLASGTYRVIKYLDYEYEEGKFEDIYVTAEFTI